ncbi:hypothetical protein [Terrihabitans sp. B22-R8]|uniref:hypothetical protein n=1 Tax=Terrihabitans sp. B22-R8 TaxID=3425128 RepID=UPI00403C0575
MRMGALHNPSAIRRIVPALTGLALIAGIALAVWNGVGWLSDRRANADIAALAAAHDIAIDDRASPEALFARLHFLSVRGRLDEAQPIAARLAQGDDKALAAAALYDLANARLRAALDHLGSNDIDPAIPLVRLAKDGYRRALVIDPGLWDAKYNLDITMRLVRDFPQIEATGEDVPPETAKRLWMDLPGLPKGLP